MSLDRVSRCIGYSILANLDQPNFLLEAMKLFCSSPRRWVLST